MAKDEKRITLLVSTELYEDLNSVIPHGYRRHVLASLIQLACKAIRDDGEMMIGAFMSGKYKVVRDET